MPSILFSLAVYAPDVDIYLLTRIGGPRNILPAIAVFSIFGASGQAIINTMATDDNAAALAKPKSSWLDSKWSPVTSMTDAQYAAYIDDKILKLDVEIAMLDDKLAALRVSKAKREAQL